MVMQMDYDRSLHGKEHEAGPFEVTPELIRDYSKSIGETNPVFLSQADAQAAGYPNMVAPPTLCAIFVRRVQLPDIQLKFGKMRFHAGQRVEPKRPIIAGDSLTASSHLKDVYAKTGRTGTMVFIVWETTFRNQRGEVVADVQESFAARE